MSESAKIIEKIIQSPTFQQSKRCQELLQYLAAASENNELIKEATIAAELFGKEVGFDPHDDPTIRVYISNLRKRLDHYYLTEGKKDKIRVEIPKGQYYINFVNRETIQKKITSNYRFLTYWILIPLVVVLSSVIIYQQRQNGPKSEKCLFSIDHPVWGEFLEDNDNPTLIVIGDYLFLYEGKKGGNGGYFVRDPRINTPEEFRQLVKKDPQLFQRFVICGFTYLPPSAVESMVHILPILIQSSNKIFLKLSSEITTVDLNRYNIIYIGTLKTLYEMKKIFSKLPFTYKTSPPQLFLFDEKADTIETFSAMPDERPSYKKDYGVIVKHFGPENNNILFLTGFDELGVIESVKTITNSDFLTQVQALVPDQPLSKPFYFEIFIEAEGIDRSSFGSTIKHFRVLDTKYLIEDDYVRK